jgi:hypothetical protein
MHYQRSSHCRSLLTSLYTRETGKNIWFGLLNTPCDLVRFRSSLSPQFLATSLYYFFSRRFDSLLSSLDHVHVLVLLMLVFLMLLLLATVVLLPLRVLLTFMLLMMVMLMPAAHATAAVTYH